jgi:hypothetical protein
VCVAVTATVVVRVVVCEGASSDPAPAPASSATNDAAARGQCAVIQRTAAHTIKAATEAHVVRVEYEIERKPPSCCIRAIPVRPAREIDYICRSSTPPIRIEWREDDGIDVFVVTYTLEVVDGATRLTQRTDAKLGVPWVLQRLMRAGIGRDIGRQLKTLKAKLETQEA